MNELFNRACTIAMGPIEITGLRTQFKIERSDTKTIAHAEITVWNLSRETRNNMAKLPVPVTLKAGYGFDLEQIFSGDIAPTGISVTRSGPDWLTTFKVGDGLKCHQTERVQLPLPQGMPVQQALIQAIGMLQNVDTKKVLAALSGNTITLEGAFQQIVGGSALSGRALDEIDRLARSAKKKVVIVDGELQLQPTDDSIAAVSGTQYPTDFVPELTPQTGLIGSPEAVKDDFTKFRCLLRPKIKPGLPVHVVWSIQPLGIWLRAKRVTHIGDTRGQEWYTDVEGTTIKAPG